MDDQPGQLTARVTIERRIADDGDLVDYAQAVDASGEPIPLAEALGMMRLAEDTLIRESMGEAP